MGFRKLKRIHEIKERPTNTFMLTPNWFTLVCISMSLTTSTFACDSNLSLESCTYNLITNTRTFNNSQYPQCWLNTQVITKENVHHKLHQQLPKCVEGILLVIAFHLTIVAIDNCSSIG